MTQAATAIQILDQETPVATTGEAEIAALAYELWVERGCPDGSPEEDWYRAERQLAEAGQTES